MQGNTFHFICNSFNSFIIRIIVPGSTLILLFLLPSVHLASSAVVPITIPKYQEYDFIHYSEGNMEVDARGKTLKEVLQAVQYSSGIQFSASKELLDHFVNRRVTASDWGKAVEKLLRDFNIAASWDSNSMLKAVVLSRSKDTNYETATMIPLFNDEVKIIAEALPQEPVEGQPDETPAPPAPSGEDLAEDLNRVPEDDLAVEVPEEIEVGVPQSETDSSAEQSVADGSNLAKPDIFLPPSSALLIPPPPD